MAQPRLTHLSLRLINVNRQKIPTAIGYFCLIFKGDEIKGTGNFNAAHYFGCNMLPVILVKANI